MSFNMDQQEPSMNEISNFVYYTVVLFWCKDYSKTSFYNRWVNTPVRIKEAFTE